MLLKLIFFYLVVIVGNVGATLSECVAGCLTYSKAVDILKSMNVGGLFATINGLSYFLFHQGKSHDFKWVNA